MESIHRIDHRPSVAQWIEQGVSTAQVGGSNPLGRANYAIRRGHGDGQERPEGVALLQ